ncbi:PREDICTED: uncharacterized protein LOC104811288 [Tarenaya hassleriana]|uniref:uncharacterized protein LOC104811288 n=1 Tax=Tarenaya hassleriana TaxID=28532 RepID=UPI0008FD1EA2|nr:PREDICTED: uncharacterized protein LOC104811288 [Tarenaya hassleriana]
MDACSNCCSSFRFLPVHRSLTSRTTVVPFPLFRSSGDLRVLYKKRVLFKHRRRSLALVNFSFLPSPFDGSVSLDSIAPTVAGVASGLAAYLSSRFFGESMGSGGDKRREDDVVGEWVLFTSPTPFNQFVLLRCSLLSFDVGAGDSELLGGLDDRLVKEERHFVRLDTGKIPAAEGNTGAAEETALEYQRFCINTEDGGVVSLDWPATLDLGEERGLDPTVILVPGTPEGSMDEGIRSFVREALRRGVFPVVMNPRGCAGSPLTTARLFTAADSDDISTAVQFITKARPWTTLMGVGWGFGANMLTKYLAEVGERTPLTAAVCIDNPFDLEEITRTSPYHSTLDRHLTHGLVEILRSNKELFQGRAKGFDVGKALTSKSIRDFEKAISMVTYGFDSVEEFYSKCSTRSVIGEVKIPVLFIQNDDAVPLFSIPRGAIAENPFTSLLLCSLSPSSVVIGGAAAVSWCHHLAIEWLAAVELGLLKGRHPLLKDIDVTVNPSKGLALLETRAYEKGVNANKVLEIPRRKTINGYRVDPKMETLRDSTTVSNFILQSGRDLEQNDKSNNRFHEPENSGVAASGPVEVELDKDDKSGEEESDRGQILQTAQVVMNMLDVTMPDTLKAEEKKRVLDAVGQGETIMKALQDAVPEDVRGKLTTSVTAILNSQGTKVKFDKLKLPNMTPGFKPKIQEPRKGPSSAVDQQDSHSPDHTKKTDELVNGSKNIPDGSESSTGGAGIEDNPYEASQKYVDSGQSQPVNSNQDDSLAPYKNVNDGSGSNHENDESLTKEKVTAADVGEKVSGPGVKAGSSSQEKPSETEDVNVNKVNQDAVIAQQQRKEDIANNNEEKAVEFASGQNKVASISEEDVGPPPGPPSDLQPVENEENDNQKKETKNLQPVPDQTKPAVQEPSQPTFSVSQAFDALTGIDDSTQVAINSVFGVLENMLSQLEEGNKEDDEVTYEKKLKDENISSLSEVHTPDERVTKDIMFSHGSGDPVSDLHESRKGTKHDTTTVLLNEKHLIGNKPVVGNDLEYLPKMSERHANLVKNSSYGVYFQEDLSDERTATQLDLDTTTALLLDYYPEEGQWKLLDQQPENFEESVDNSVASGDTNKNFQVHSPSSANDEENIIEPSCVILDNDQDMEQTEKSDAVGNPEDDVDNTDEGCEELMHLVKVIILDSLSLEVQRRMSSSGLRRIESQLNQDIDKVADAVSLAVADAEHSLNFKNINKANVPTEKICELHGETIIRAISLTVQETRFLRQVLPVGVVVGSILAALRKYFDVSTVCDDAKREAVTRKVNKFRKKDEQKSGLNNNMNKKSKLNGSKKKGMESGLQNINNDQVMVGAVTAALGASALLVQQQDPLKGGQNGGIMSKSLTEKGSQQKESEQSNMVANFAEKAMSIAGPVVPTKEDGEVDQERLVAMLADLGQKGGILKLVGKFALLWGGIRGAMSLTDRLISFLHVAELPLPKR